MSRPVALLVVLLMCAASGCTTKTVLEVGELPDRPASVQPSPHNAADASYAQHLGILHEQALVLAGALTGRDRVSPELRDLAGRVRETRQGPMVSLDALRGTWGVERLDGERSVVPGELTDRELRQLHRRDGAAFERLWLERLTDNYEISLALTQDLLDTGLSVEGQQYAEWLIPQLQQDLDELGRAARG